MKKVQDLPAPTLAELKQRLAPHFPLRRQRRNCRIGFHMDGVLFHKGTLYYHSESAVDTLVHEAAHALLLTPEERAEHVGEAIPTGGAADGGESDELLLLQVQLCDGLPEYGVDVCLAEMEAIGYFAGASEDVNAQEWYARARRAALQAVAVKV